MKGVFLVFHGPKEVHAFNSRRVIIVWCRVDLADRIGGAN